MRKTPAVRIEAKRKDILFPPGKLLARELEARGMSQAELARRMGRPSQAVSEIIHAKKAVTAETALELERVLGISGQMWLNLEFRYREVLARKATGERLRSEAAAEKLPEALLVLLENLGELKPGSEKADQINGLLMFFGTASLSITRQVYAESFRSGTRAEMWLRAALTRYMERTRAGKSARVLSGPKLVALLPPGFELPPGLPAKVLKSNGRVDGAGGGISRAA